MRQETYQHLRLQLQTILVRHRPSQIPIDQAYIRPQGFSIRVQHRPCLLWIFRLWFGAFGGAVVEEVNDHAAYKIGFNDEIVRGE
jgi:hypothetical protein